MGIIFHFCFALILEMANMNICTVLTLQNFSWDANLEKKKKLSDLWANMHCANFTKIRSDNICSFFVYLNVQKTLDMSFHHYKVLIFKRRRLWKPSLFLRLFMLELSSKAGHSKENYKKSVRKNVFLVS